MTAVAGILNKQGIAIAADSAVTVNGAYNRKVYNSANKIFTLSKYHPVGIAIYNNAHFMGVPWEIIIKEYRKELQKSSFPKLENYKDDFFNWLEKKNFFIEEPSERYLKYDFVSFIQKLVNEFMRNSQQAKNSKGFEDMLDVFIKDYIRKKQNGVEKLKSLEKLNSKNVEKTLKTFTPAIIDNLNKKLPFKLGKAKFESNFTKAYLKFLLHNQFLNYSGLIFVGYGEEEIFPRLYSVNVSIVVDNLLRYELDNKGKAEIGDKNNACIRPFAQTDVINTILQGVSPELNFLSVNIFQNFINEFTNEISNIPDIPKNVKSKIENLNVDKYVNGYHQKFQQVIQQKHVSPLMGAVAQLSKEDLAEMAESLVYLTYLKRRFTMAEESVGGPVDIAVITKGDGFIWIKRKHYFDPELNQGFYQKYF